MCVSSVFTSVLSLFFFFFFFSVHNPRRKLGRREFDNFTAEVTVYGNELLYYRKYVRIITSVCPTTVAQGQIKDFEKKNGENALKKINNDFC